MEAFYLLKRPKTRNRWPSQENAPKIIFFAEMGCIYIGPIYIKRQSDSENFLTFWYTLMWSPPSVDDVVKATEEPAADEVASSTKKPFVPSRKKNGLSSVDLFKKFRKFNKTPRTPSFSTTAKPTTPSGNLVRSTTLMFGDRTTQKTKEKFLPTQFSVKPKARENPPKARENPIVKTRQRVLNRFGFDPREKNEEATEATENAEELVTTTPYDASLNITLTNLNMTASDVKDKANLTVPGIDTLFKGITHTFTSHHIE